MKDKFILGRFLPGNSFMHRLDPRVKLVGMMVLLIVIFFANSLTAYFAMLGLVALMIYASDMGLGVFIGGLRPMLFLIIFTVTIQLLFTRTGTPLWQWGPILLTVDGLENAFFIFLRFLLIIFISTVVTLTTAPLAITDALESLFSPVKNILPVHEMALMLSISLRFVPTLMEETDKIMDAQRARGVDFSQGGVMQRIKSVVPILIPLFVSSFNRAYDLATAMEARGYRGGEGRTKYRKLQWQARDTWAMAIVVAAAVGIVLLRYVAVI